MDVQPIVATSCSALRIFRRSDARALDTPLPSSRIALASASRDSDQPASARVARADRAAGTRRATERTPIPGAMTVERYARHWALHSARETVGRLCYDVRDDRADQVGGSGNQ